MRGRDGTSRYAGLLFTVRGAIAWASRQPFIFPSLGPTTFVLAFDRRSERTHARRVVGATRSAGVPGWPPGGRWGRTDPGSDGYSS